MSEAASYLNHSQGAISITGSAALAPDAKPAAGGQRDRDRAAALHELRALDDRRLQDIGVRHDDVAAMLATATGTTRVRLALVAFARWLGAADRVILTTAALFLGLAVLLPEQFLDSLRFTLDSLWFVAPFLLLSAVLAAGLSASGADRPLARILSGQSWRIVVAAAAFAALSPLCSVSVVPLVAGLLSAGVPLAPIMAFWVASPLMDPEMFILTVTIMDLPFALVRAGSALAIGLAAGFATLAIARHPVFAAPLRPGTAAAGFSSVWSCSMSASDAGGVDDRAASAGWIFWRDPARRAAFRRQSLAIGIFLLKWLTLAFLIESLMVATIPGEMVAQWLGGRQWWVVPASVLVGIPTYLNGYAAMPTVSALMDMGMQPGAALGFMTAGEVTSLPTAMSVLVLVRRPVFLLYLALGLGGSLLAGGFYQMALSIF